MYKYLKVLRVIYECPRALQSDFARQEAFTIAEAASRGHISSLVLGEPRNYWYITTRGLEFLEENMEVNKDAPNLCVDEEK